MASPLLQAQGGLFDRVRAGFRRTQGRLFDGFGANGGGANPGVLKRVCRALLWAAGPRRRWTGVHCLPPMCPVSASMCSLFAPMCPLFGLMCPVCVSMCSVGVDDAFAPAASALRFPGWVLAWRSGGDLRAEAVGLSARWTVGCYGVTRGSQIQSGRRRAADKTAGSRGPAAPVVRFRQPWLAWPQPSSGTSYSTEGNRRCAT